MAKIKYKNWNTSQDNRIHLSDGLAPALGSSSGSSKPIIQVIQKTGGYCTTFKINETGTLQSGGANVMDKVPNIVVQVKSATKDGYEEATQGDSINLSVPNSTTRRGRVGKQQAQTLDTQSNQAVVISHFGHKNKEAKVSDISPTLKAESHGHEPMTSDLVGNIRRLTEIECERLQGYPDNHTAFGMYPTKKITQKDFNKLSNEEKIKIFDSTIKRAIPKTQRYKLCGNAVTTDVVELIGIKMLAND